MKRRFGMWIGIICILIVGVSVTRMTKDFVVSKGVAASSILDVMDTNRTGVALAGGAQVEAAAENGTDIHFIIMEGAEDGEHVVGQQEITSMETVTASAADSELTAETVEEKLAITMGPGENVSGNGLNSGAESASPENFDAATSVGPGAEAAVAAAEERIDGPVAYSSELADVLSESDGPGKKKVVVESAEQETVKSPLDPVVETKPSLIESDTKESTMMVEDFFERFESAESTAMKLWDNITTDNVVAYYAAAEQERVLWDYELNLIYGAIREKMSEEEAEELKHLELDWLKERDQYAEKMAAKSPIMNSQNQNPVYTRALAEKTKERCYWLIAEYEDILERIEPMQEIKIEKKP